MSDVFCSYAIIPRGWDYMRFLLAANCRCLHRAAGWGGRCRLRARTRPPSRVMCPSDRPSTPGRRERGHGRRRGSSAGCPCLRRTPRRWTRTRPTSSRSCRPSSLRGEVEWEGLKDTVIQNLSKCYGHEWMRPVYVFWNDCILHPLSVNVVEGEVEISDKWKEVFPRDSPARWRTRWESQWGELGRTKSAMVCLTC